MLPLQHARGQKGVRASFKKLHLRQKGWHAFAALLVLLILIQLKGQPQAQNRKTDQLPALHIKLAQIEDELKEQANSLQLIKQFSNNTLHDGSREGTICRLLPPQSSLAVLRQRHRHKMAVVVPCRGQADILATFLPALTKFLKGQGRDFSIFLIEQSPRFRFNRGMLLNAATALLRATDYDYLVFHDDDLTPTELGSLPYDFPYGDQPLHLAPTGIHPTIRTREYFGGVVSYTTAQLEKLNGYSNRFWGWGGEDENMQERLLKCGMWPPKKPNVPKKGTHYYYRHSAHPKQPQVRVSVGPYFKASGSIQNFDRYHNVLAYVIAACHKSQGLLLRFGFTKVRARILKGGARDYYEADPDDTQTDSLILSKEEGQKDDFRTGLNSTHFWIKEIRPVEAFAVSILVDLYCDETITPWCRA